MKLGYCPDISKPDAEFPPRDAHDTLLLSMTTAAVALGDTLPGSSMFQTAEGVVRDTHIVDEVALGFPTIIEVVLILAAAFPSFETTSEEIRHANHFIWGATREVAELFTSVFITMWPALTTLEEMGLKSDITEPFQML